MAPRTARAAMRHSDIQLTTGIYSDPRLLDVRGALDSLPTLRLAVSGYPVNANDPLTRAVSGSGGMGAKGFEPLTPSVSSWCSSQLS